MLQDEISKVTPNWDNERIAQIDLILLQMCLSEFLFFESIPLKVSINEYLEIGTKQISYKYKKDTPLTLQIGWRLYVQWHCLLFLTIYKFKL